MQSSKRSSRRSNLPLYFPRTNREPRQRAASPSEVTFSHGVARAGPVDRAFLATAELNTIVEKSDGTPSLCGREMKQTTSAIAPCRRTPRSRSGTSAQARSNTRSCTVLSVNRIMRGMIAGGRCDHFRREPYPPGARGPRVRATARRPPARSRVPASMVEIRRLGRRRMCDDAKTRGKCGVFAGRAAVRSQEMKKPAAVFRRGRRNFCDDVTMPVICPTSQTRRECGKEPGGGNGSLSIVSILKA
jgi:hypothetical protein